MEVTHDDGGKSLFSRSQREVGVDLFIQTMHILEQ